MGHFDALYEKLPVWAQHSAVSVYGWYWHRLRFGAGYARYLSEYTEREWFNNVAWQIWQQERLSDLLYAVATKVPYYQQTWNKEEKSAALAGRLDDLPLLGKDPIRKNPDAFLRKDIHPRPRLVHHTSGSSQTLWKYPLIPFVYGINQGIESFGCALSTKFRQHPSQRD